MVKSRRGNRDELYGSKPYSPLPIKSQIKSNPSGTYQATPKSL